MKKVLFLLLLFFSSFINAQNSPIEFGGKISLLVTIGSHQSSFGLGLNVYSGFKYAQINAGTRLRFFGNNYGKRNNMHEWRHEVGAVAMWGKQTNPIQFEYSGALHQQRTAYSLGYSYLWYFDNAETSQRSGVWNLGLRQFDILFENDVFGGQAKDRFRTGAISLSYRDSINKYSVGLILWTGETRHSVWNKTPMKKCPSGYRDLTPLLYGHLNHGILFGEYKRLVDYNQYFGFRIGRDSEQTRHLVQNRFAHDLLILPKSVKRNTPHYPRLDVNGNNAFEKKDVRPATLYFSTFLNDGELY